MASDGTSKTIELAKKLHRLVVTPYVNEAQVAATKLSGLVARHGIRLSDLQPDVEYRDRIIYRTVTVVAHEEKPKVTRVASAKATWGTDGHHKIDDDMYGAMQRCSCGEWFTDCGFYAHLDKVWGPIRHGGKT